MDMPRRLGAEFFGTFWLTFAGCGSAVLAASNSAQGLHCARLAICSIYCNRN
jgi:aquaporin Z